MRGFRIGEEWHRLLTEYSSLSFSLLHYGRLLVFWLLTLLNEVLENVVTLTKM